MSSQMSHEPASAAIWRWRPVAADPAAAAARARRGGLARVAVGLLAALLLAVWKPLLGVVAGVLALLLLAVALSSPRRLYPRVERSIAAFARGVGQAVSWVTLTLVHVLVFLPLGLFLRATGRLRIARAPDPGAPTYWRPADRPRVGAERYERQF